MNSGLNSDYIFKKRIIGKRNKKKHKIQFIMFFSIIIIVFLTILTLFIFSDQNKIYRVNYYGNKLLSDDYLRSLANFEGKNYFLTTDGAIESKLAKDPFVESVKVKHTNDGIITVKIVEKKLLGYIYNDKPYVVDLDGNKINIDASNQFLISKLPIITGFNDKELTDLVKKLSKASNKIIFDISEIKRYKTSYDDNSLMIILRDGNYLFASGGAIELINKYYSIVSNIKKTPACIFFDEVTSSAYSSKCPWE